MTPRPRAPEPASPRPGSVIARSVVPGHAPHSAVASPALRVYAPAAGGLTANTMRRWYRPGAVGDPEAQVAELRLSSERRGDSLVVAVGGELDIVTSRELDEHLT